jgi:hypothetical protein
MWPMSPICISIALPREKISVFNNSTVYYRVME